MEQTCETLFVYGTLRSEFFNPASMRFRDGSRFMGPATVRGHLFHLKGYPGAIHDPGCDKKIHGELYQLINVKETFFWLDEYEDGNTGNYTNCLYQRIRVPVIFGNKKMMAWMYAYIQSTRNLERIDSGDYRKYAEDSGNGT
jgi:gamma-glutamylcyclotransferase (GGCT)/AIG2-like uncharacterized protein YtfP